MISMKPKLIVLCAMAALGLLGAGIAQAQEGISALKGHNSKAPVDVTGPLTLTPKMVMCTDVPVTAKPIPRLVIAGPHKTDGRTAMSDGLIVINRTPDDGLALGQRYTAQRLITDPKRFPRAGEGYGDLRRLLSVTAWPRCTEKVSSDDYS